MSGKVDMPGFSDFAQHVAQQLGALALKDADDRLADARHVMWGNHFSGFGMAEVAFGANVPTEALELAQEISTEARGNIFSAEEIFLEIRICLFVSVFGVKAGTPFGDTVVVAEKLLFGGASGSRPN